VAGHGLGGTYRNLISKQISNGLRFERVADGRRGAVGVEVADDAGIELRIAQRVAHDAEPTFVLGGGLRHVIRVRGHTVANYFRQDGSAAAASMLEFFENQDAGAFAHHEAIAVLVPGPAGASGIVVASRKRAHVGESVDTHGRNGSFRASGNHYVVIILLADAQWISDGVSAGGASRFRCMMTAL